VQNPSANPLTAVCPAQWNRAVTRGGRGWKRRNVPSQALVGRADHLPLPLPRVPPPLLLPSDERDGLQRRSRGTKAKRGRGRTSGQSANSDVTRTKPKNNPT
jgi:hypothetical protein